MPTTTRRRLLTAGLLLWCFLAVLVHQLAGADWANWRGPSHNGVSPETDLPATWSDNAKKPVNFLWKVPFGARSTPIVMHDRVFINNQVGKGVNEQERVMCFDAKNGKVLWEQKFNVFHTDIVSVRLGWTNLVGDPETGNIYWQGTQGWFVCFNKDGKILWQRQLMETDGRISGYGGRLPSPALAGDLVVMGMINSGWGDQAKAGNRFLAMNKHDGTPVWWSETSPRPGTYFSTPTVANIGGQDLLISGCSDGAIHALQAGTGKPVWGYVFCKGAVNCSPAVEGTLVYANHGEESPGTNQQGRVLCVDAGQIKDGKPKLVWQKDGIKAKYTSPLVHGGRVYIGDDVAKLWCFDGKTGNKLWTHVYGRNAMASPVWGDGKIYVSDKNAKFHILQPGDKDCTDLDEHLFPGVDGIPVETYGNAAIADGKVYFSTRDETYCIGDARARLVKIDRKAKENPQEIRESDFAQLSIYPCDVVAHPGQQVQLKLRVYDKNGKFLVDSTNGMQDVKWTLPQPALPPGAKNQPPALQGTVAADAKGAKLTISKTLPAQQGYVEAEWKGLKAKARVRVAPTLPYTQDFEKVPEGGVPAGWINCQGKFLVKKLKDGNQVLAKVTTSSNAAIAGGNCFFGTPQMTNYTIEADVLGGKIDSETKGEYWMPDIGIGACRYTLLLGGQTQTLRVISWEASPRVDEFTAFRWLPDTWYRLKLTAEVAGGKTTVRGKAWPRGQKEPEKWMLEFADPTPNLEGAPLLFGYVLGHGEDTPGTEVYFDNVQVTPNKK